MSSSRENTTVLQYTFKLDKDNSNFCKDRLLFNNNYEDENSSKKRVLEKKNNDSRFNTDLECYVSVSLNGIEISNIVIDNIFDFDHAIRCIKKNDEFCFDYNDDGFISFFKYSDGKLSFIKNESGGVVIVNSNNIDLVID